MFRTPDNRLAAWWLVAAGASILVLVALLADQRSAPGSLLPHGYCFTWNPSLLWTHVVSDSVIGLAYVSIPVTLLYLVRKRGDLPFNLILLLFATFIVSCGASHWVEVWTVWYPDYWLSGNVKIVTATASVLTAGALIRLVPEILAVPTVAQLTRTKEALEDEVRNRRAVEEELQRERAELEYRVEQRTHQLAQATASAEAAHAAAEEANRQKDRFLAKVSHELRTPLQSTLSWAHVLRHAGFDPNRAALAAERIIHNVGAQARLIDDLLDISRILSGKLRLDFQEVDPIPVIEKALDVVRANARAQRIEVVLAGDVGEVRMTTDPARLEQVVWNLTSNAVQSTVDGGHVRVNAGVTGTTLQIEVQDWGRGIAPDDLPHIFEPFRQGVPSAGSHRGLGLGLAITRNIVELFGGTLEAHSEGTGRGARFVVRLPMQGGTTSQGAASGSSRELEPRERSRLQGLRVLYIEDDPDIGQGSRIMLAQLGANVELCRTFEEACRRIEEARFDVLLSDLNLDGGHTGADLLRALRRLPQGRDVPAVILSAYDSDEDRQASSAAGFVRHLVKPIDAVDVARALVAAVQSAG